MRGELGLRRVRRVTSSETRKGLKRVMILYYCTWKSEEGGKKQSERSAAYRGAPWIAGDRQGGGVKLRNTNEL